MRRILMIFVLLGCGGGALADSRSVSISEVGTKGFVIKEGEFSMYVQYPPDVVQALEGLLEDPKLATNAKPKPPVVAINKSPPPRRRPITDEQIRESLLRLIALPVAEP